MNKYLQGLPKGKAEVIKIKKYIIPVIFFQGMDFIYPNLLRWQ